MTPSERRQVAALLRRAARRAENASVHGYYGDIWDWLLLSGATAPKIRDHALREWHRVLPRRREVGIGLRVLLALMLSAAIEAGDLP